MKRMQGGASEESGLELDIYNLLRRISIILLFLFLLFIQP